MKELGSVVKEILDNIGDGILFVDRDYSIVFANRALLQICGQEEQEVIGQKCYGLFHQSPIPCQKKDPSVVCSRDEVFRTGRAVSATHTHKMQDGTEKVFDITASPIMNEKGEVIQVLEILRDVTEKKKIERELKESEEEFRLLFETALDAIFWADPKTGLIINCNKAAETLLEKKREEIIGYPQAMLHPPQKSKHYSEMFRRHIAEKGAVDNEAEVITKSGKIKPVHIAATVTSIGGKQIIQGIFRDITERKRTEEEIKATIIRAGEEKAKSEAIVASIGDALGIVDTNYVIKYQNQVSKNLLGDHIGEFCYKAYKGADQICEKCPVAVSLKDGKIHRTERSWSTDKGLTRLEVTASPLRDSTGKIIGGIEVVRDITERKWMEEALQEEKNKLQAIVEAMEYGLTIQDRDYNIIYQNKVLKKTFGRMGEKCYRVYEGKEKVCDECPVEMAYRDGKSHTSERHVTMPSGESTCWENTANPIRNAKGEIVACLEIARNITERKKVEELLKESEKKYRNLVDNAHVGVYKTNLKGEFIYINEALQNIFEFESPEEMMQQGVLVRHKNPKTREVLIKELQKTGKINDFEFEGLAKTGKTKHILLSAVLEGDILSGMIMDVTEQRRAEKAVRESETFLSSIFEGIQDGVVVLDKDFLILFANSSYIEQIGRSSNEIKCKHCYEVSYDRDEPCYLAGLECSVKNVFETGLSSREVRKKDGKYMEIIVYPLKDSSGKVISVVEIRRDVTKNMQLNEEVKIRVRELEEFYDMAVGRELKMVELKEEVERLKEELRKYKT